MKKHLLLVFFTSLILVSCGQKDNPQLVITIYNHDGTIVSTGSVSQFSVTQNNWELRDSIVKGLCTLNVGKKGIYFLKFSNGKESCQLPFYSDGKNDVILTVNLPLLERRENFPPRYISFPRYAFSGSNPTNVKLADINDNSLREHHAYMDSIKYYMQNKINHGKYVFNYTEDIENNFLKRLNNENDTIVREMHYISGYLMNWSKYGPKNIDSAICHDALHEVDPDSPFWSLNPNLLLLAVSRSGGKEIWKDYLKAALEKHPDPNVKAEILFERILDAKSKNDLAEVERLCRRIEKECKHTYKAKTVSNEFLRIAKGKKVPSFSLQSMENKNEKYTDRNLLGKFYLMDFWATWCSPCVAEMGNLDQLYKKYGNDKLTILSISLDKSAYEIIKFRAEKWKMPWKHSLLQSFESDVARNFGVSGIPKVLLVSPDGIILAVDEELRGSELFKTVSQFIK